MTPPTDEAGATCPECGLGPPPLHKAGCVNNVATKRWGTDEARAPEQTVEPAAMLRRILGAENRDANPEWYVEGDQWPFVGGLNWIIHVHHIIEALEGREAEDEMAYWAAEQLAMERP